MLRRRPVKLLALLLAIVVVFALWSAYQAWRVSHDLSDAATDAQSLQDGLTSSNPKAVDSALAGLEDHTSDASDRTSGWSWGLLTHLPLVGDDAGGVRLVSAVLADLSTSGIKPLAEQASDLTALLPKDGQIPVDKLQQLQQPVASADTAFISADHRLSAEKTSGFLSPLQVKYTDLADKVSSASSALSDANTALKVMPSMLGADGPRNYLLIFQNNAEIRATGGLPGAVALLHVEDGKLTLTQQVSGASFGATKKPVLPISKAERKIYGSQFGTYFLDANFTPDFPRAAELWQAHWQKRFGGTIDGVVSLDPVALSYILEATGPVTADNTTLTSDNAVDELLHTTYLDYPDPAAQDAHFQGLAAAIFTKVTAGGDQPRELLDALQRAADEHRLYLHSFNSGEDGVLASTELEGSLTSDPDAPPDIAITINDTTGSKMSYYLRYATRVTSASCTDGVQTLNGDISLQSLAPKDAATSLSPYVTGGDAFGIPVGSQLETVRIYSPLGGTLSRLEINGKKAHGRVFDDLHGRQVLVSYVILGPQRTADLTWSFTTGRQQTGDVAVDTTPGIAADQLDRETVPSSC